MSLLDCVKWVFYVYHHHYSNAEREKRARHFYQWSDSSGTKTKFSVIISNNRSENLFISLCSNIIFTLIYEFISTLWIMNQQGDPYWVILLGVRTTKKSTWMK